MKRSKDELQYIIVLGAHADGDVLSPVLKSRCDVALEYLRNHANTGVIVSGGQGSDETCPEAISMKNYFMENGIEEDRIIVEDQSTNTKENIENSSSLLVSIGIDVNDVKVGVASSDYHIARAKALAQSVFASKVSGIPAKSHGYKRAHFVVREAVGMLRNVIR